MSTEQFYRFLYLVVWPFFNLFHPVRTVGREHIPEGAAVICPNHTALSDPFFVAFAFQKKNPLRVMAKIQLMRVPVIGWLLGKAGIFGVDRGHADMHAAKTALRCLKEGHKLLIFPEWRRGRTWTPRRERPCLPPGRGCPSSPCTSRRRSTGSALPPW